MKVSKFILFLGCLILNASYSHAGLGLAGVKRKLESESTSSTSVLKRPKIEKVNCLDSTDLITICRYALDKEVISSNHAINYKKWHEFMVKNALVTKDWFLASLKAMAEYILEGNTIVFPENISLEALNRLCGVNGTLESEPLIFFKDETLNLSELPLKLSFERCSHLNDQHLIRLMKHLKQVVEFTLIGCPQVTQKGIEALIQHHGECIQSIQIKENNKAFLGLSAFNGKQGKLTSLKIVSNQLSPSPIQPLSDAIKANVDTLIACKISIPGLGFKSPRPLLETLALCNKLQSLFLFDPNFGGVEPQSLLEVIKNCTQLKAIGFDKGPNAETSEYGAVFDALKSYSDQLNSFTFHILFSCLATGATNNEESFCQSFNALIASLTHLTYLDVNAGVLSPEAFGAVLNNCPKLTGLKVKTGIRHLLSFEELKKTLLTREELAKLPSVYKHLEKISIRSEQNVFSILSQLTGIKELEISGRMTLKELDQCLVNNPGLEKLTLATSFIDGLSLSDFRTRYEPGQLNTRLAHYLTELPMYGSSQGFLIEEFNYVGDDRKLLDSLCSAQANRGNFEHNLTLRSTARDILVAMEIFDLILKRCSTLRSLAISESSRLWRCYLLNKDKFFNKNPHCKVSKKCCKGMGQF